MREKLLRIAHDGHQNMRDMKNFLDSHVWFPDMDEMIVKTIAECKVIIVGRGFGTAKNVVKIYSVNQYH